MFRITASGPGCVGARPSFSPGCGGARRARGFRSLFHRVTGPTGFHVEASPDCRRRTVGPRPGPAFFSLRRIASRARSGAAERIASWLFPLYRTARLAHDGFKGNRNCDRPAPALRGISCTCGLGTLVATATPSWNAVQPPTRVRFVSGRFSDSINGKSKIAASRCHEKRSGRDSNPRYLAARRFSRPVHSTTLPLLRSDRG